MAEKIYYNKKNFRPISGSFLKISFLKVICFSRIITAGSRPVFIRINIFQRSEFKKKKLTDIGLLVFPGIKGIGIFQWIWIGD